MVTTEVAATAEAFITQPFEKQRNIEDVSHCALENLEQVIVLKLLIGRKWCIKMQKYHLKE